MSGKPLDRMELEAESFRRRVYEGFLSLKTVDPRVPPAEPDALYLAAGNIRHGFWPHDRAAGHECCHARAHGLSSSRRLPPGDAQAFIRTACFNMSSAPLFTKWLHDLKLDQRADGAVPHVVPNVLGEQNCGSSAWGDAATICPWTLYSCYGDRRILEQQYSSMKAWVEYIRSTAGG